MGRERRRRLVTVAALALLVAAAGTVSATAQLLPPWLEGEQEGEPAPSEPTTTTTTAPAITLLPSDTTAPPDSTTAPPQGAPTTTEAPPPSTTTGPADAPLPEDPGEGSDGAGLAIPPEAQAVIDSIVRTAPNDNAALVAGVASLEAVGVPHDEAVTAVYGAFPIHGPANWSDDWYFPRWTGTTFRHHLGLDMFAAYGTPVAAPADGIARIAENALGGLTVRVVQPDGTFWYLAHLSGTAEGLVDGAAVTLGQEVGYVGDSGNARGGSPHLHFAVHPGGGDPVPPKPIVDEMVRDGAARVIDLLAQATGAQPSAALLAADLTRRLADGVVAGPDVMAGPPRSELLWASAANPNGGAVAVADATAASLNEGVDWEQRAAQKRSLDLAWAEATERAWVVLSPLVPPALRPG
jgi:murein DD-endopeptidase MepM/ murein hydrolase activator NlpD